jgi:hypothetical protein
MEGLIVALFASAAILLVLAVVAVLLRIYVRVFMIKSFGADDYLMVIALVRGKFDLASNKLLTWPGVLYRFRGLNLRRYRNDPRQESIGDSRGFDPRLAG